MIMWSYCTATLLHYLGILQFRRLILIVREANDINHWSFGDLMIVVVLVVPLPGSACAYSIFVCIQTTFSLLLLFILLLYQWHSFLSIECG